MRLFYGLCFLWAVMGGQCLVAQRAIYNGVTLPTRDTLRVLVVFASIDYSEGNCPGGYAGPNFYSDWPRSGDLVLWPERADSLLDGFPQNPPHGMVSYFYHKASFGEYVLLGDFPEVVVRVPCSEVKPRTPMVNEVLRILDSLDRNLPGGLKTRHGFPLSAFDDWSNPGAGLPKIKAPDGKVDLLYIIWQNNRYLFGMETGPNSGYGVASVQGIPFGGMQGLNTMASFNNASGIKQSFHITIAEHLHGIFGGNEWHTAGGAGTHSTLAMGLNFGATAQLFAPMLSVCGWDRWMMNWKNPEKAFVLSALDARGNEVPSDIMEIPSDVPYSDFWLRDFVSTGDAIRIRLPHLDLYSKLVKNQYIWLEYRTLTDRIDAYLDESLACVRNGEGNYPRGVPGIYAYYQIGKDVKEGEGNIYSYRPEHPNGLGGYLVPVSAEGRFDIHYVLHRLQEGFNGSCSWNNSSIPIDRSFSKPNPFTGQHDLWQIFDQNGDGKLYSGDTVNAGHTEIIGDSVVWNYFVGGDWKDAFSFHNGQTHFGLNYNPSPTPLYTLATRYDKGPIGSDTASFENRTVWLNGIHIELLEEGKAACGSRAMKIRIYWRDYTLNRSIRWCGNIVFAGQGAGETLHLKKGARLFLERGESPVRALALKDSKGRDDFSEDTRMRVLAGAEIRIERGAKWYIKDNSILEFMPGSRLYLAPGVRIKKARKAQCIIPAGVVKPIPKP
jgi:hypothetical protein